VDEGKAKMSGEDDSPRMMDSNQAMRRGKPQQLRKRKANSSDEEDNGAKSEQQSAPSKTVGNAPAKGSSTSSGKPDKPKKAMSRGLSFATDEGGGEEEEPTFQLKKKTESKTKVLYLFSCKSDESRKKRVSLDAYRLFEPVLSITHTPTIQCMQLQT
jgi:hypothetical protein